MPKPGSSWPRVVVSLLVLALASPARAATDHLLDEQWGLQRVGAPFTWGTTTGAGVLLAVVDTGIDLSHPDLRGRVLEGKDFVDGQETTDAQDEHGHGTLVAGIAGAATDNDEGISGTAPNVSLMAIRVIGANGEGFSHDAAEGIDYAVTRADQLNMKLVMNLSFDWYSDAPGENLLDDPEVVRAIKRAAESGALVVLSSGNSGQGSTAYNERTDRVLVVGSSNDRDQRASFSNYGSTLDLLAPGIDILTTYFEPSSKRRGYAYVVGTSMSAPFVSGTAALLMSRGMNAQQAAQRMKDTARDVGPAGWDEQHGNGILDAANAVGVPRTSPAPAGTARGPQSSPSPAIRPQTTQLAALPSPTDGVALPIVKVVPAPAPREQTAPVPLPMTRPISALALGLLLIVLDGHLLRIAIRKPTGHSRRD